ncbi:TPA: 50S ribosomal protein L10 [bacterium]|nr:50S ribosomal protein L10 [bacterium]
MKQAHIVKERIVDSLKEKIKESEIIVLTDMSGLSVSDITNLRRELAKEDAKYLVAKNRLFARAGKDLDIFFEERIFGPTAFLFGKDVSSCKVLLDFIKKNKKPTIKLGFLKNKKIEKEDVEKIARLPERKVLIAQVISGIQSPISSLVYTLSGVIQKFVFVLSSIAEEKSND